MAMSDVKPWHDCPACPGCGSTVGCTRDHHSRGEDYPEDVTLCCPACGHGWTGSAEDLEKARRADAAWDEERRRQYPTVTVHGVKP